MALSIYMTGALLAPASPSAQTSNPKLKSPTTVRGFYRQASGNQANNQTGTFVFLFWNGPSAETDTLCALPDTILRCGPNIPVCEVPQEICDSLGVNCQIDTVIPCRSAWSGYRVRRTVEGIDVTRMNVFGQWKGRDTVGPLCVAQQAPCDLQNFVFTGSGIFFKGFRNNRLSNGTYVFDYPPGNPADADSTARVFVDLSPLVGFPHEYAVTSIDTLFSVNADFQESAVDSSELVRLTPATPPVDNLEHVAVVPNPYKGSAEWDPAANQRRMHFVNLPAGSTVRIYTAAGELLRTLTQNPASSSGGTTGELEWDLLNDYGLTVVSGIYLYSVHPPDGRTPKKGHFVIIK